MTVQVYLEIPNGEKLAEALHSKVMSILGSSIYVFSFDYNGRCCYLGEREIVSWDLKVGTCTGFNAFFKRLLNLGICLWQGVPYIIYWKDTFSCYAACHFRHSLLSVVQRYNHLRFHWNLCH